MSKALEAAAIAMAGIQFPNIGWRSYDEDEREAFLAEAKFIIRAFAENVTDEKVRAAILEGLK